MKHYLLEFRDQVFNGALSLYKRIFVSFLVLNILYTIISTLLFLPLILEMFGWGIQDLLNIEETIETFKSKFDSDPQSINSISDIFPNINLFYSIPMFLIAMLLGAWSFNLYLSLNNNEVKYTDNKILSAFKASLNANIFKLLGCLILLSILSVAILVIFFLFTGLIMSVSKAFGILVGFVGFFVVIILLLRFILAPAAIVHGKMGVMEAFAYSFKNLTMKRAAMLGLMGLVVLIIAGIISTAANMLVLALISKDGNNPFFFYSVQQLIGTLLGTLVSAFMYSGLSALYFRYSEDEIVQSEIDHIVTD